MIKSTHSKIKNTAILFELLSRQVAADTLRGVEKSPALTLIREHFKANSQLAKELVLYQALLTEKCNNQASARALLNAVIKLRNKLNINELRQRKYNLISQTQKHYNLSDFFKTGLTDYKVCASIYRVFEGSTITKVAEVVKSRFTIVEHLVRKPINKSDHADIIIQEYLKQDEDIRLLAYKLMMDKFNNKYSGLSLKQKSVLREYINSVSNTTTLSKFLIKESALIAAQITKLLPKVEDKVIAVKLTEVSTMLGRFSKMKTIKENHVLALLLYYELIKELKNAA